MLLSREIEIITLIALEFSGKEIERLFISTNTVETHQKYHEKLKAKTPLV
jgi:ATP/maltotriose-dependent transcriptional regulator MalT